ncbi:MAG TPA: family 78 glycoside hydrolase catalytic domain, partial [Opitutaceae bacterium]|nr:family 78 glycoside hydrolase catalytic domain [Opitutaceae bacterium]
MTSLLPLHWNRLIRHLLFAIVLGAATATTHAALQVTNLRCDWASDPVGIDSTPPRLAWQLASVERGARQSAWEIQVASSRRELQRGNADRWDSGRVTGDAQFEVPYQGRTLRTGEQVFWRVRAWDEAGRPSAWSAIATWMMGVTSRCDWTADWITDPELLRMTRTKLGFSTPPVRDENTPEWIALDLGRTYPIDSIVLDALVHTVSERLGFPRWFKVEVANNPGFQNATVVADHTKEGINVWFTRFAIPVPMKPARYVRITATKLRMMEEEDQPVPVGRLALRQIEVYADGNDVAIGARVTASSSLEEGPWSAASVVDGKEIPGRNPRAADTLLLRREFAIRPGLRRALLFVTGLGTYTASIDGTPVGAEDLLKPGWTETARTCLYDTRDVTSLLKPGANAIGITLAGGMYNVAAIPGRYTKFVSASRPLLAFAELRLEYDDGTTQTVNSDAQWQVAVGPTTFAHVYGGEDYDARKVPVGWDRPGFTGAGWRAAVVTTPPGGALRGLSESAPPIRAVATLPPLTRHELSPGVIVYDLGQNAAVMPHLRVHGAAGSTVKISPAELLKPDGSIDPSSTRPASSDASWNYTLDGRGEESWSPQFFYHGARYLQVECTAPAGAPLPVVDAIDGIVIRSASSAAGEFSSSNELLNRIATLVRWAQSNNMVSVLTDCPHRERLGWLEQYHLNGPSLRYDFDVTRLYAKGLDDMSDAQRPNGLVPDIAPEYIRFDEGFRDSPEWGSAFIIAAWQQYVWSGDATSLRRHYAGMQRYFEHLASKSQGDLLSFGLGDWYDLGPKAPGIAQLTPIALTATAIYYEDATTLERIAEVLGHQDDAARFRRKAAAIGQAFNARFLPPGSGGYATNSQTSNAMPLVLGLVPTNRRSEVVGRIVADIRAHDNGLTAGDVGYRYLLRALAENNRSDVVFDMNDQTEKPGYGYQLAHGATSLTEAWDANRHSSQDHFMLGQIVEWLYHDVAGLAPDPDSPGFGRAIIRPNPVGDLLWARAKYDSVRGCFSVAWRREPGRFALTIDVPANARALVELPVPAGA